MIRKEWKRMLALSMTYIMTLSVAAPVKAAEEELSVPTAETAAEVQETPEQFEARTGYHLTEGYTYVYLYSVTPAFENDYKELFQSEIKEKTLYQISEDGDSVILKKV